MGKPSFFRYSDQLKPANSNPRRSLRLQKATHPNCDDVSQWDAERSKLRHISELAEHPRKAKRAALRRTDSLKLRAKRQEEEEEEAKAKTSANSTGRARVRRGSATSTERLKGEPSQEEQAVSDCLKFSGIKRSDYARDATPSVVGASSPTKPQLITFNFRCASPSLSQISPEGERRSPPKDSLTCHLPKWLLSPSKGLKENLQKVISSSSTSSSSSSSSSAKSANETPKKWKQDVLKKTRRPRKLLVQVLKTSGQILTATTTTRRDRDFTKRRRISIHEVVLLNMKSTLEENL